VEPDLHVKNDIKLCLKGTACKGVDTGTRLSEHDNELFVPIRSTWLLSLYLD
jgi:hypothetical protein